MIILKSQRDLELMRPAGTVAGTVLDEITAFIKPGLTTRQVDEFAAARIKAHGAKKRVFGLSQISVPHVHLGERRGCSRIGWQP